MSSKNKARRVKLIANPGAGEPAKSAENLKNASLFLQEFGLKVEVALAHPKKKIAPIVKKALKNDYEAIIVMGGDGTIEALFRAFMSTKAGRKSKVPLGILPSGTYNNIAKSLGIPDDLRAACRMIAEGTARKMDIAKVTVGKKKPFYFFELVAIGLTAALYPEATEVQKGRLDNIKEVVTTFLQHETHPTVYLSIDGESKIKTESLLVTVSNTPAFGMNFLVAPQASLQDGLLDVSLYPTFSKPELIAYYARVMNEGDDKNKDIQRYRVHTLKVKSLPKLQVMADGEMLGKGTVRIKALPGALRIFAPKQGAGLAAALPAEKAEAVLPAPLAIPAEPAQ